MKRSHSRHSSPLDKQTPLMPKAFSSIVRQEIKKMHKKKQRQWNKKLIENN